MARLWGSPPGHRGSARRARLVALGAVIGVITGAAVLVPPSEAAPTALSARAARHGADFDGNGYADLALYGSDESGSAELGVSLMRVMYGGAAGLSLGRVQAFELESIVADGGDGLEAGFGIGDLTTGDFDGDGFDELVIGIPGLKVGSTPAAGGVLVLPGSAQGLDLQRKQLITQASEGVAGAPEEDDRLGESLTAANFGRGTEDDLVVGVPSESLPGGIYEGGQVHVLYGSSHGLDLASGQVWRQNLPGLDGRAEDSDNWGGLLVAGHFAGSPYADLAVGSPSDHYHEAWEHGAATIQVLYGTGAGLTARGSVRWSARAPGLVERADIHSFPADLAVGDFDADGYDDLVASSGGGPGPEEWVSGSVIVFYGSRRGVTADRVQTWSQASVGVAGVPEDWEWFGAYLAVGNLGRDSGGRRYDDLVVSVSESTGGIVDGGVHVIFGGPRGLTGSGSQYWTQRSPGVSGVAEDDDDFGGGLAVADFGRNPGHDRIDDLAVVASDDNYRNSDDLAGALHVLYGGLSGPTARGSARWTVVDFGVPANGAGWFPVTLTS